MLLGEYEHTIDDKNRLTLPARFRHVFAEGIVVTRGVDGCLSAYTPEDWETLVENRLGPLDPLSKEGRRMAPRARRGRRECRRCCRTSCSPARLITSPSSRTRCVRRSTSIPATPSSTRPSAPAATPPCSPPISAAAAS